MNPNNIIKGNELLLFAKEISEQLSQIKSDRSDDDYDAGVKEGKRMTLQGVHDLIMGRLSKLLKEEG
ncbi:hypothetical protein ABZ756_07180 [Mammaliicoccus sciuri]